MDASQALAELWSNAALPASSLSSIRLTGRDSLPSSFRVGALAQATLGAAALAASQVFALRTGEPLGKVTVSAEDAAAEFRSEQLGTLDGRVGKVWDDLAGIYRTRDGWIRPHTNWKHHKEGLLKLLRLPPDASKEQLTAAFAASNADEVAEKAMKQGLVVTSLRSFEEWDASPQGQVAAARSGGPLGITRLQSRPPKPLPPLTSRRPLEGVRVLDLTRVIAGPTAGRTLAAYGADVLWVTAPHLPTLPGLDADTSRGKRTIQLDLCLPSSPSSPESADRQTFISLLRDTDVLLQAYRPNGLASLGFSVEELLRINPDLVYATLSAYGEDGPWKERKGFDSLVQFAVGINEAEGRASDEYARVEAESVPKALPCQALDHGSGYLLAFGMQIALLRRATEGGAYKVENSLLATATWLRSFGRSEPAAFSRTLETREEICARGGIGELSGGFGGGALAYVKHAAKFEGAEVGWGTAATGYNDAEPVWRARCAAGRDN